MEKRKKIRTRSEKIQKMEELLKEKSPRLQSYVSKMLKKDMKLSWNDLVELAIGFASEKDEEFFKYLQANYKSVKESKKPIYVPPAGMVISTEEVEAGVAAVLGIGIGWIWIWLAVSPWTCTEREISWQAGKSFQL